LFAQGLRGLVKQPLLRGNVVPIVQGAFVALDIRPELIVVAIPFGREGGSVGDHAWFLNSPLNRLTARRNNCLMASSVLSICRAISAQGNLSEERLRRITCWYSAGIRARAASSSSSSSRRITCWLGVDVSAAIATSPVESPGSWPVTWPPPRFCAFPAR